MILISDTVSHISGGAETTHPHIRCRLHRLNGTIQVGGKSNAKAAPPYQPQPPLSGPGRGLTH